MTETATGTRHAVEVSDHPNKRMVLACTVCTANPDDIVRIIFRRPPEKPIPVFLCPARAAELRSSLTREVES